MSVWCPFCGFSTVWALARVFLIFCFFGSSKSFFSDSPFWILELATKKNCISFNEATCNPGHQIPETWHSWKPADPERCHVQGRNWPQIFGSSRVIKLAGILIVVFPLLFFSRGKNTKNGILLEDGWKEKLQVESKFSLGALLATALQYILQRWFLCWQGVFINHHQPTAVAEG